MAKREHLKILKQGVKIWNVWRENNPEVQPDLRGALLAKYKLNGADLSRTNLNHSRIIGSDLSNAILRGAELDEVFMNDVQLVQADLSNSRLTFTDFTFSDLSKAILANALVVNVRFHDVSLRDTDFNHARMLGTSFSGVDLSLAKGLEGVKHLAPSTIGIDTLYQSGGKVPEIFLRGCGVPDDLITFVPSHFGIKQAIQFYSCFISYSTKDEEFARRLYSRMRDEHLRVWFAPEDIKGGQKLHEQIERAIQIHDRLLLILSEYSMQSEWVMTEIRNARRVEVEQKRRKLFPIRLVDFDAIRKWKCFDTDDGKDLAVEVREYFIPDFSNWKDHDAFEAAFERLLHDLKAEESH